MTVNKDVEVKELSQERAESTEKSLVTNEEFTSAADDLLLQQRKEQAYQRDGDRPPTSVSMKFGRPEILDDSGSAVVKGFDNISNTLQGESRRLEILDNRGEVYLNDDGSVTIYGTESGLPPVRSQIHFQDYDAYKNNEWSRKETTQPTRDGQSDLYVKTVFRVPEEGTGITGYEDWNPSAQNKEGITRVTHYDSSITNKRPGENKGIVERKEFSGRADGLEEENTFDNGQKIRSYAGGKRTIVDTDGTETIIK